MIRDNYICIYCKDAIADVVDHVIPFRIGGRSIKANGVACCRRCNMLKKNDRTMTAYGLMYLIRQGENIKWLTNAMKDRTIDTGRI